jgi:hypothetical protein
MCDEELIRERWIAIWAAILLQHALEQVRDLPEGATGDEARALARRVLVEVDLELATLDARDAPS